MIFFLSLGPKSSRLSFTRHQPCPGHCTNNREKCKRKNNISEHYRTHDNSSFSSSPLIARQKLFANLLSLLGGISLVCRKTAFSLKNIKRFARNLLFIARTINTQASESTLTPSSAFEFRFQEKKRRKLGLNQ